MRVYRVHLHGNVQSGPWFIGGVELPIELPEPFDDGIEDFRDDDYCACASIDSLVKWFGDCAKELYESGFVVSVIEVCDSMVKIGKQQVAIKLSEFKVISTIECVDIIKN